MGIPAKAVLGGIQRALQIQALEAVLAALEVPPGMERDIVDLIELVGVVVQPVGPVNIGPESLVTAGRVVLQAETWHRRKSVTGDVRGVKEEVGTEADNRGEPAFSSALSCRGYQLRVGDIGL